MKADHEELVPDKTHILDTLFHAVDGLHSAIRHDLIVERPQQERVLVQHEVSKLAREAADALKQSHQLHQWIPIVCPRDCFEHSGPMTTHSPPPNLSPIFPEVDATNSSALFKALLKSIATFDSKDKRWHLKQEFAQL